MTLSNSHNKNNIIKIIIIIIIIIIIKCSKLSTKATSGAELGMILFKTRMNISIVVQFYPWFKFYFPLFQTLNHTLPYPRIKENKI